MIDLGPNYRRERAIVGVDARTALGNPDLVVGLLPREGRGAGSGAAEALGGHADDGITVSVFADDLGDGVRFLRALSESPELRVLPLKRHAAADVVVVVATRVDDPLLLQMEKVAAQAENSRQRMVLISDPMRESQLSRVVGCGVVSILPRAAIAPHLIVRAVVASGRGEAVMPKKVVRRLLEEAREFHQAVRRVPPVLAEAGLTDRELDVLRMFADGHDTGYVAVQLRLSERTIKKIVQDLTRRLGLRNRTHAVSYALRAGVI
ncbi:LuxR C-terminal-related transcriptional regulator [Saccharopolyspora shandongensis]|uniref:helix-turn-helix transcriptional regulator n=1 Tax=Saccharopolyspora shandongensis TaxID=418495 RepID=UPI00342BA032